MTNEERTIKEQYINNTDLEAINQSVQSKEPTGAGMHIMAQTPKMTLPEPEKNVVALNCRITRKLEGGRPHKVYDYMFIQMSNEQFKNDYEQKKIFVTKPPGKEETNYD